ncbi:MAG: ABC transporter ATP-binding protein [Planctomycetes bacterium]|nr:ABC transporter ATP-binding protein [Planctomycetota bacterium]
MIRAEDLTKNYGAFRALTDFSLEVKAGEIFGLVGPNGAGKTTFLKCLLGIVNPTAGRCMLDGIHVQARPVAARSRCGFLPGEDAFPLALRGATFLADALDDYPAVDRELERELVDLFRLPLNKRLRAYSHGMRRKIGIVQALAPRVPIAILDEPEDGLDPTSRLQLTALLRRLRDGGRTILFSSHHLDVVAQVCDRVAFIAGGRLLECATIEEIRDRASHRLRVRLAAGTPHSVLQIPEVESVIPRDGELILVAAGDPRALLRRVADLPIEKLEFRTLRLEDLYSDLYGVDRDAADRGEKRP